MSIVIEPRDGVQFSPPLPLDLVATQSALVARLKAAGSGAVPGLVDLCAPLARVEVAGFPDQPGVYRLTHPIGAVLVLYEGSQYTKNPTTADEVRQERTMVWSVTVTTRDLGWAYGGPPSASSPGAYRLLESVRYALSGFQENSGYTKMVPLSEKFIKKDVDGGAWYYEIRFCHRTTVINVPPQVDYATLTAVQYARVVHPDTIYTFDGSGNIQLPYANVTGLLVMNPLMSVTYELAVDYTYVPSTGVVSVVGSGALAAGSQVVMRFGVVESVVNA